MTETVAVALITGGVGIVSAIFSWLAAFHTTKKQCETQIQDTQLQMDAQLRQSILREAYDARQKAFTRIMEAYTCLCQKPSDEAFQEFISAVNAAHVVASTETAVRIAELSDSVRGVYGKNVKASEFMADAIIHMQKDLSVFTMPQINDNPWPVPGKEPHANS